MANSKESDKRKILKMEYPRNLLYAVRDHWENEEPTELTPDVLAGIQYALTTLNEREQYVIAERYQKRRSLRSIGEDVGVIPERIRQIESHALRVLRHPRNMTLITKGVMGYIKKLNDIEYERGYQKGFDDGYEQGVKDAPNGVIKAGTSVTLSSLPIEALDISTRAFNALKRAGFNSIGDLVNLTRSEMIHIKNLGPKQRGEVAAGLRHYGLSHTNWDLFYHERKEENEVE